VIGDGEDPVVNIKISNFQNSSRTRSFLTHMTKELVCVILFILWIQGWFTEITIDNKRIY